METELTARRSEKTGVGKIRSRYKKCLNEIQQHFNQEDNTGVDTIHDLRVNLKRVDALLALIRFNNGKRSTQKLKIFQTLFNIAGKLRSVQVEFEIVYKHFNDESFNPNYLHQLHELKAKRLKEYSKFIESGPPRRLLRGIRLLKKKVSQITRKDIIRYLDAEEKILSKRLKRSIFREQELHFLRKDLKRYYLTLKMSDHQNVNVEKLLDLLGTWHDYQITFDHVIEAIYAGRLTAPESDPIKKIKYDLINEKEGLYEKIVSFYAIDMHGRRRS
jgi:hypothetical protein